MDAHRPRMGCRLEGGGLPLLPLACARIAVDPRPERRPGPVDPALDLPGDLGNGYRRLFRGPPVRQAQAGALHQSRQDRGRPLGRSCRGCVIRCRLGDRDGPEPCPDPACSLVCGRRAGGRLVRKQDEAQGRGQGLRATGSRAMAASWTVSMVSFRLPSSPSRREQQDWREENIHPRCHGFDRQIDARPDRAVAATNSRSLR